jgi:hypothetical protein
MCSVYIHLLFGVCFGYWNLEWEIAQLNLNWWAQDGDEKHLEQSIAEIIDVIHRAWFIIWYGGLANIFTQRASNYGPEDLCPWVTWIIDLSQYIWVLFFHIFSYHELNPFISWVKSFHFNLMNSCGGAHEQSYCWSPQAGCPGAWTHCGEPGACSMCIGWGPVSLGASSNSVSTETYQVPGSNVVGLEPGFILTS